MNMESYTLTRLDLRSSLINLNTSFHFLPFTCLPSRTGSDHKGVDNFRLFKVMQAAIDGADRPSTNDLLEQLLKVIIHTFNFHKKISVNIELLQYNAAQMAT